jgi:hypothetical protein
LPLSAGDSPSRTRSRHSALYVGEKIRAGATLGKATEYVFADQCRADRIGATGTKNRRAIAIRQ